MAPPIEVLDALERIEKEWISEEREFAVFKFLLNFSAGFGKRVIVQVGDRSDKKWAEKQPPVWLNPEIVEKIFRLSFGYCKHGHINTERLAVPRGSEVCTIAREDPDDIPYCYDLLVKDCPLPRELLLDTPTMWFICDQIQRSLVSGRSIKFLAPVLENLLRGRERAIAKYKTELEAGKPVVERRLTADLERDFLNIWASALLGALNGANPECASFYAYCKRRIGLP
ncbi:MAG: hypothetical protein KGQ49_02620 [Verrucomicrobia bacterium]|nr:hypothetical protein [Verrucomicrobiota bacterium]MBU6446276.1 hypothetical protein [Verrucomicrobiota bacterium]MDE3047457.1 hypothetical protein [Verrucomicrobiota bacterium]